MSFFEFQNELEKIRQQYDLLPYPESDIALFPNNLEQFYIHSLATPYYLRYQKRINTQNKIVLDAGCGSGMQALALAIANPGAKIVGVDISEKSIELARQRFAFHQLDNAEFYAMPLEEVASLGYHYDLINCDEVLYLLPNPGETLKLFDSLLSDYGIIRANLHSYHQRIKYYRNQELFKLIGLYDENSLDTALTVTKETLANLKHFIEAKIFYQDYAQNKLSAPSDQSKEKLLDEWILTNYLLKGDKGYTIPELFSFLEEAELDFLCMVNWRQWRVEDLFIDPENLPLFWQLGLDSASEAEKLHIYELLNPSHRLLDFWCGKKSTIPLPTTPLLWEDRDWEHCLVSLHPVLQQESIRQDILGACQNRTSVDLSQYIKINTLQPVVVDCNILACLLPLWNCSVSFTDLLNRWLVLQPVTLDSLAMKETEQATKELKGILSQLEHFTFIFLSPSLEM